MSNESRDTNMNLKELQQQATELTGKKVESMEDAAPVVGQNWFNTVKDDPAPIFDANGRPLVQLKPEIEVTAPTNAGPVLPNDGVSLSAPTNNVVGEGMVIEHKKPEEEEVYNPLKYTGIAPDTQSNIDKYMADMDTDIEEAKQVAETVKAKAAEEIDTDEEDEEDNGMTKDEFDRKYNEAVVVIDKTGMGSIINFTDEEREKLERAKKIKLEEVETISLASMKTKKAKKGSLDKILKRQPTIHTTPIVLPASGYTAIMMGCSTYELIGLMTDTKNVLMDTETKWSLIHNKVDTTSLGKMEYNEFLQHTAAVDYNVFVYGLLCATYPDDDKLPLKCEKCEKEFDHKYSIKSLIRAEKMSEKLQDIVVSIVDAEHTEGGAKERHEQAPVNQVKMVRLPISGFVVEMYVQSAYDFINKSIKGLSENKDPKLNQASVLSSVVRTLYIPDPDAEGEYFEFTDAMDIAKTIYTLGDTDILVITKQGDVLLDDLSFEFGLMNVECPHCHHHTVSLPMDLESVLFYKYQQAMTTTIE